MNLTDLIPAADVIPCSYSELATPEYERIINNFLQTAPSSDSPRLIHMSGLPGAGKSTFYQSRSWDKHVFIGFDNIMEQIDAYRQDVETSGSAAAFSNWELPARIIGYELLRRAVESRRHIFFDHGGINPAHINLLKNLKKLGYSLEMYYIRCTPELALSRVQYREQLTHRHTPCELIENRSRLIDEMLAQYKKIVDAFYTFDSTDNNFHLCETIINRSLAKAA